MSASERGGGAGGYLRDTKATVYYWRSPVSLRVYIHQNLTYAVLIDDHWILTASRC